MGNTDLTTERNQLRAALRDKFPREHGQLLPALHHLQHEFGYLPDWGMEVVGWHLGIPSSEVYGAATSYSELRTVRPGTYVVRVCTGLACRLAGALDLLSAAEAGLGVSAEAAAENRPVTLEETPCGFLCGVAPAVEIDGSWRGRTSPEALRDTLREWKQ